MSVKAILTEQQKSYTKAEEDALLAAKQDTLTFDNVPAFSSQNPVKSDGIFKSKVPVYGLGKNLLDNWDFSNPVNQRRQSSYTATQNGYTIDRWYCNQPRGTVTIRTSDIQLTKTASGSFQFIQKINPFNKPCTLSVLLSTGSIAGINVAIVDVNGTNVDIQSAETANGKQLVTCYYDGTNADSIDRVMIAMSSNVATNSTITLYAAKLELGNQQTLCHNEGTSNTPIWVLNEIPDYGEELRKCQRYYFSYPISSGTPLPINGMRGDATAGTNVSAQLDLPVVMYKVPTVDAALHSIRGNGSNWNTGLSVTTTPLGMFANHISIEVIASNASFPALTNGYVVLFTKLNLSAEL